MSAETSGFRSVVAKFAGAPLRFHDLPYLVEMPRLKIMRIHSNVNGQRGRLVQQFAVRMSVKMPDTAMSMMPDPHRVVTKNDPLAADLNLRHLIPTAERALEVTKRRVVISFDHVYVAANDAVTVPLGFIRAAETEVSEEIEHIVLPDFAVEIGWRRVASISSTESNGRLQYRMMLR